MHASDARRPSGLALFAVGLVLAALAGCSKAPDSPSADQPAASHHEHLAPHGGTLIALGDHQFNLELVHDATQGRLSAYILDAHAEKFVRIPLREFSLIALVKGEREVLTMAAVANAGTGETVGDTSEFVAQAPWLKYKVAFDALIPALEIRGATFEEIRFAFRSGSKS